MKQALVVLALVGLAFSAPQPRKLFHEHVEEFLDIIMEEAGPEMQHLTEHYIEFEEFVQALDYMRTNNFKDLVYEMESLPEFVAVSTFGFCVNFCLKILLSELFFTDIDAFRQSPKRLHNIRLCNSMTCFFVDSKLRIGTLRYFFFSIFSCA